MSFESRGMLVRDDQQLALQQVGISCKICDVPSLDWPDCLTDDM